MTAFEMEVLTTTQRRPRLLPRLHKLARRQDENFVTEALAYLLEVLELEAPSIAEDVLCCLLGVEAALGDGPAFIRTQYYTSSGRPDMRIETSAVLAFIEVKVDAQLGTEQLPTYRRALDAEPTRAATKRLVLLSRLPITVDSELTCHTVRWDEIASRLRQGLDDSLSPIASHVLHEFLDFMEERGLKPPARRSIVSAGVAQSEQHGNGPLALRQRFTRLEQLLEYPELKPVHDLLALVGEAIDLSGQFSGVKRFGSGQHSGGWIGWNLEGMRYFIYFGWSEPEVLQFQRYKPPIDPDRPDGGLGFIDWRDGGWRWNNRLDLLDTDISFLSLTSSEQVSVVLDFIRLSHAYSKRFD